MELKTEQEWHVLLQDVDTRQKAFSSVISTYQERLYWHIRRIVVSHENANDVLQNTFMKAWTNLDRFRGDSKISTWLFRIATNESIDYLNQLKKEYQLFADNEEQYLQSALLADPYFDGDALQLQLQQAILSLPERQRLIFNMRYFDELKYEEIAEILGVSVGALKASYHIAQKKIQEYFRSLD